MNATSSQRTAKDWVAIAANFGVVFGLVMLAYELNQANKLAETEAYIGRLDQMQQTAVVFGESQYLPDLYQKLGGAGQMYTPTDVVELDALTDTEHSRLYAWEMGVMLRISGHYYQYLQGYLDEPTGQKIMRDASARYERWKALGIEVEGQELQAALDLVAK